MMKFIFLILIVLLSCSALSKKSSLSLKNKLRSHLKHHMKHRHQMKQDDAPPPRVPGFLSDENGDGKSEYYEFARVFENHHLTSGEIKSLFNIADVNKNNRLTIQEWTDFRRLFVVPFEECDTTEEYQMDAATLSACIENPDLPMFHLPIHQNENFLSVLMDILVNEEGFTNLADYIFLRRANFAWGKCSVDNKISKKNINCAITAVVPHRRLIFPESKEIFDEGLKIKYGKYTDDSAFIGFLEFFEVARIFHFFEEFEVPFNDGVLQQKDILRAIDDHALPNNLTPFIVRAMYESIQQDEMTFPIFTTLFRLYRFFHKYSQENPGFLNQAEFESLLRDAQMDPKIVLLFEESFIPDLAAFNEIAAQFDDHSYNESDFFIQFLQTSAKSKIANLDYEYHAFDSHHLQKMTYQDFIKFFKFTWLWMGMDTLNVGMIGNKEIKTTLSSYKSIIPFNMEELLLQNKFTEYMKPGKLINIQGFFAFFQEETSFADLMVVGTLPNQKKVNYQGLTSGFKRFGAELPDYFEQPDSADQQHQPLFNYHSSLLRYLDDYSKLLVIHLDEIRAEAARR